MRILEFGFVPNSKEAAMKKYRDESEEYAEGENGRLQFQRPSQLFLIRLSVGEDSKQHEEWHGKVQHAVTGETHYFHSRSELTETLLRMMPGTKDVQPDSQPGAG
jgi:hypothetical protein